MLVAQWAVRTIVPHRHGAAAILASLLVWPGAVVLAEGAQASCDVTEHAFKYLESIAPGPGGRPFEIRSYRLGADGHVEIAVVRSDGELLSRGNAEGDESWLAERWLSIIGTEPERQEEEPNGAVLSEYYPGVVRVSEMCDGHIETIEFLQEGPQSDRLEPMLQRFESLAVEQTTPVDKGYLRLNPIPRVFPSSFIDRDFDDPEVAATGFWEELFALPGKLLPINELAAADPQVLRHGIDPGGSRIVKFSDELFMLTYYE